MMDTKLLGETVVYRHKRLPKDRYTCDAIVIGLHPNRVVDLYLPRKGESVNTYIDSINNRAYIMKGKRQQEKQVIPYSDEPIPGTWGYI